MVRSFVSLILFLAVPKVYANSCCGQNSASFMVLTQEQRLSVTTALSVAQAQGRIFDNSKEFYVWSEKQRQIQTMQFNVAGLMADRHQLFANGAVVSGRYKDADEYGSSTNATDILLGYTYEILPEYRFSYWKPVVFLSVLANLPTGHSIYDTSRLSEGSDVTGHNQWGTGLGITMRKVVFPFTLTVQGRSLQIFAKQFENAKVSDFYDSSLALLFNYATPFWDVSTQLGANFNHLSERRIAYAGLTSGVSQNTTLIAGLQKVIDNNWNVGMSYADQTLMGVARNTILNRTVNLTLNFNYY